MFLSLQFMVLYLGNPRKQMQGVMEEEKFEDKR